MLIKACHVVISMPTLTIYLTNELYDKVRDAPSKTVRAALECYFYNAEKPPQDLAPPKQATDVPCNNAAVDGDS